MARRGFFAELERQSRIAAQQRERAQRGATREHEAAVRRTQQAQRAAERAHSAVLRATEAERKQLDKADREAHLAAMEAEVDERNLVLAVTYHDIDSLLASTLDVDDYVDLETLRRPAEHPPFDRTDLELAIPPAAPVVDPREPVWSPPRAPSGLGGLFGKKKHAEAVAAAEAAHQRSVERWREALEDASARRSMMAEEHARAEADRLVKLEVERRRYTAECEAREQEAAERSKELDQLIANLGYGTVDAIQEYVSIVLSRSVYQEHFPVTHAFEFSPEAAELRLQVLVPGPEKLPVIKAFKYTKASDSITSTAFSQKETKERYAGAVHQVTLRSLHEVFEADRRGLIQTISLEVGTRTADRATGREIYVPFVAVGAERESFMKFDLSAVVPSATLAHLGGALSKDPYHLLPADTSGIRRL